MVKQKDDCLRSHLFVLESKLLCFRANVPGGSTLLFFKNNKELNRIRKSESI
jgi:hypothetical protein